MAKDIRVYIGTISSNLNDYHTNLTVCIDKITEHEAESKWKAEWLYKQLSDEIKALRSYLNICNEMIDHIPDSKKTLASAKKKLASILKCIEIEQPELECLQQAKSLVKELAKINL
jgi:2-polyprenyl-3-methyl-5-hydroxy-6-metoxy-1,4-benzoquinol methylase